MKKVLFINPFGIGDVLFTTPVIASLKKAFPQCMVGYWCNERVEGLLRCCPGIDKTFPLSRGDLKRIARRSYLEAASRGWRLFLALRRERFDAVFDYSLDHRYGFISMLLRIPLRVGFDYRNRGRFLTHKIPLGAGYAGKHAVDYYLSLLEPAGIPAAEKRLWLNVPEADRINARIRLQSFGVKDTDVLVGIAPGAGGSWGKNAGFKHWPIIKYGQLAELLMAQPRVKVVILGDSQESQLADTVRLMTRNQAINLVGRTNYQELLGTMSHLSVLVANDGGILHLGSALDLRTVSIFGPVDETVYGPYPPDGKHTVIAGAAECRPCYKGFSMKPCDRDKECLNLIKVEDVFQAVLRQLHAKENR